MKFSTVQSFIAVIMVGVFVLITASMALFPLISERTVPLDQYSDYFSKTASVYTGIIGVIIGYYFGKATQASSGNSTQDVEHTDEVANM